MVLELVLVLILVLMVLVLVVMVLVLMYRCCLDSACVGLQHQRGSNQLLAGGGAGPPPPPPPPTAAARVRAGLKSNDASCRLRQAVRVNELAPAPDRGCSAGTWKCSPLSEGWGPAGAGEGACRRPTAAPTGPRLFEECPNFHISSGAAD